MLLKKLIRTIGNYKAQFISMIIMIALGIGVFVGFNMEWYTIEYNTNSFFEADGFADYRVYSDSGFSEDNLVDIKAQDGIDDAARYITINMAVKDESNKSLGVSVTDNFSVSGFVLLEGEEYDASSNGIWLSKQYATKNELEIGDELTLTYRSFTLNGNIVGLIKSSEHMVCVKDENQLMPDFNSYGFAYVTPSTLHSVLGFDYYTQINIKSDLSKTAIEDKVDSCFGTTTLVLSKEENTGYSEAYGEVEEGQIMGSVLPVLFLLIAILTMVTTMHRLTNNERKQIGTLKALGFKDGRIARHYMAFGFLIGLIGIAFGIGIGYLLAWIIMNPSEAMGTYLDLPTWTLQMPWFAWLILAAILVFLSLISYLSVRKVLNGTPAEVLRPSTSKTSKRKANKPAKIAELSDKTFAENATHIAPKIENYAVESKKNKRDFLSFGTRWNLRDIARHKSRSLMTLIGVVGCAVLIIASLGMNDTMNSFMDTQFDELYNYETKLVLSDDCSNEYAIELSDTYEGDWSSATSVQIEDKAVACEVYGISRDKIRFINDYGQSVSLSDDGALVCRRIMEEYSLSVGDSITYTPYGSDDEYTAKVSAEINSMTEGIIISPAYAESIGYSYSISYVYTSLNSSEIITDDSIAEIQAKQTIIDSMDSFMTIMNTMIIALIVAAIVLGVVVLYNLGVMSYAERYREMATLKVVGFKDSKISRLLISQNLWLTVLGIIIGIPAGYGILAVLMHALAGEYELRLVTNFLSYVITIAITAGVSLIVSAIVARKNKKINMVEALKDAE